MTVQSSPVFTGSKIISKSPAKVFALDPSSGDLIWEYEFEKINGSRGFTYDNTHKTVYVPITLGVIELDAENWKKIRVFESGSTTVPPIIHNGIIFIATLNEGVKAYSLNFLYL